ncbi:MAG: hypothetical protein ACOY71_11065 [Gemmatimonadota bacterium]
MHMRTFALAALVLATFGCKDHRKELEAQLAQLAAVQDSIIRSADSAKTELAAIDLALQSTETKLMGIKLAGERSGNIRARIDSINMEIDRQEAEYRRQARRVTALRQQLVAKDAEIKRLARRVDSLAAANEKLASENAALRDTLQMVRAQNARLQAKVDSLTQLLAARDQELAQKTVQINTAYIVANTEDSLKAKGIIDKKGKTLFFGGRTAVARSANARHFRKIDISSDTAFTWTAKADQIKVVSVHPEGSYRITDNPDGTATLHITNPDEFWLSNKLLVVQLPGGAGAAPGGRNPDPFHPSAGRDSQ